MPRVARALILGRLRWRIALAVAVALPGLACADAIYKWIDKDGKTQYSGQPPKNFSGEVTRIEIDPPGAVSPATPRNVPDGAKKPAPAPDVAGKRREVRNKLEGDLDRARAKLELAREQLADGAAPQDGERQIIQQRVDKGGPPPPSGGWAPRSNCRVVTASDGKPSLICAAAITNEAYRDRQRKLEEAVRQAEEEVAAAEQAYRRGVD